MKLFGHPIHIMLIHFPSALFPMDLICSFLAVYYDITFTSASFYAMMGGTVIGWLAVITGCFDLINISQTRPELIKKVLLHGGINTVVLVIYSLLAYLAFKKYPQILPDDLAKLIIKISTVSFMFIANYLGGNLILKNKVGIEK
ncbi:MAG: DUF2231 domain-containing protein [Bacteroidia bacterium]